MTLVTEQSAHDDTPTPDIESRMITVRKPLLDART